MYITAIEVDEASLWNGAKVKNLKNEMVYEVFVLPKDKTISQCVLEGTFKLGVHVEYTTVMLNKHLFDLVNEDL